MPKNGIIVFLMDVLLAKFRGLETLLIETTQQGFFYFVSHDSVRKNWLRYVKSEPNSLSQVQKSAHTNCLDPNRAQQYMRVPTEYKYTFLRNQALGVCPLLPLCCRFQCCGGASGCSSCNLLVAGGTSRVPPGPGMLSSFTLSHLLSKDVPTQRLFEAEVLLLPMHCANHPRRSLAAAGCSTAECMCLLVCWEGN